MAQGQNSWSGMLILLGMLAVMYLMLIRPQKKQEKKTNEMRNNLKVGDDIVTIGGFFGKIVKIKGEVLTIQIGADKVRADIAKWAVSKVVEGGAEAIANRENQDAKSAKKEEAKEEPKEEPKKSSKPRQLKKAEAPADGEAK